MAPFTSNQFIAALLLAAAYLGQSFILPVPHSSNVAVARRSSTVQAATATPLQDRQWVPEAEQQQRKPSRVRGLSTHDEFLSALAENADRPVVIKFYDTHCRACKAIAPKYDRMAHNNPGMRFYEIEFSQSKPLCKSLGIKVLPTLQVYQGAEGKIVDMPVGPKRFEAAEERLEAILNNTHNGLIQIPN